MLTRGEGEWGVHPRYDGDEGRRRVPASRGPQWMSIAYKTDSRLTKPLAHLVYTEAGRKGGKIKEQSGFSLRPSRARGGRGSPVLNEASYYTLHLTNLYITPVGLESPCPRLPLAPGCSEVPLHTNPPFYVVIPVKSCTIL